MPLDDYLTEQQSDEFNQDYQAWLDSLPAWYEEPVGE